MDADNTTTMTISTIVLINVFLSVFTLLALAGLVLLAHRLPSRAPHADESWGTSGDPWVASDPLPLAQLAGHEAARSYPRAA
jgi:hypothetical protein